MYFSPKLLAISFGVAYIYLLGFYSFAPGLENTVIRNGHFNPFVPLKDLIAIGGFPQYWTNMNLIPINLIYTWIVSYFAVSYFYREQMDNKEKRKNEA